MAPAGKSSTARRRALREKCSHFSGSRRSVSADSAIPSTSPTGRRYPSDPFRTTSGRPPRVRSDDRDAARHRLERRETEGLGVRRQQEELPDGEDRLDRSDVAQEHGPVRETALARQSLGQGPLRTVADQEQPRGNLAADPIEDRENVRDPLHRPEIGDVDEDRLAGRTERPRE
jgi:hypothetical protein